MSYEKWHSRMQEGAVDLRALEADIRRLETRVSAGEAELNEKRAALDLSRADLDALRSLRTFFAHGTPSDEADPTEQSTSRASAPKNPGPGRPRSGRRDAILSLLADGQPLHTLAIRQLLVDAGEMQPDQPSYHGLQVMLSQMYRADELDRPRRGVYQRPIRHKAAKDPR